MSEVNIDSLLDADLDSFADLPDFVTPPPGTYSLTIEKMEAKEINSKPAIEIKFKVVETQELANASDTPVEAGTPFNVAYILSNEFGQGAFKKVTTNLKEALGVSTTRELMEQSAGSSVVAIISNRKDRNDASKVYVQVVDMFLE